MANLTQENRSSIWKERFENRKQKLTPMFEAALKHYDIMYAVQSTTKVSPWKSKVYVPILASKAWDLIARMSDVVPEYSVTIKNELEINDATGSFELPEAVKQRQARIEAKLQYDYNCGHEEPMKLKVFDPLVDAVVAGTGYAYAPWIAETKQAKARSFDERGTMDNENTVTKKTETGHNGFEGINFFNVFPADATSFFKTPYLIIRGQKPKVDMEMAGVYVQSALDRCDTDANNNQNEFQLFNVARNRVVNESDSFDVDETVEVITYYECYERTAKGIELTTFAEGEKVEGEDSGWVEIRPKSIPYWHNFFPVVPFYCRKKSYSVFGESLFENNRTLQSATNDLFNHYLDNWNLSIESMLMYEDGSLTNDFIIEPGGEITYTGEAPKQFKFPEPNPQQLSLVMNVLEKGVDAATFSPYASGTPSDGNDKTQGTAYGVKSITEAATTKIGFFRDNFKQSMKVVGQIWLSNLQQFSDDPAEIRRVVDGKVIPDLVMPSDYQGEVELDIDDDSMTPISKQDKRDMNTQFTQDILALQDAAMKQMQIFGDPTDVPRFNFVEMAEEKAQLYTVKDFERMLLDNKVQPPAPPEEKPKDPKELLNFSYKDAPPDVQSQIEQMYGFTPSSIHHSSLAATAVEHGASIGRTINEAQGENPDGTPVNQPVAAGQPTPAGNPA